MSNLILNKKIIKFILQIAAKIKKNFEIKIRTEKKVLQIENEKNSVKIINFLEKNLKLEKNLENFAKKIIFDDKKLILRNENEKNFLIYDKNLILQQKINFENEK